MTAPAFRPLGQTIVAEALRAFGAGKLTGRRPEDLRAKRAIVVVLRNHGWAFTRIGRLIGIDNGTARHHFRKGVAELETDAELRAGVRHLIGIIPL